ncbi:Mitochondrial peroxiredoxin PRX1 [Neolecta irregularis DAH-3]|uniref:Mitochondrial peroxiredoxin PRX1 n=1 Tax=Neolecta irregularis (strain DAH-3) TaxID=1198029 RepID=A0A1U7LWZ9_NEOID|nr:Mitochondrial peroxiredoxin PRX1 [Neolecta irregularis DAH-3]|eukprot:OLL27103.1 Mitochondrial peroxiredoxin PRX1 [Neolecta irregularis DAH-3]
MNSTSSTLRLGCSAPNFDAQTTKGPINFYEWAKGSWVVFFCHPADFTPVCTTELGEISRLQSEFEKRGVKIIGLSANDLKSHEEWIRDINEVAQTTLTFPIIADADRKVALLYDMVDHQDATNVDQKGMALTIRSVFFIDPLHTVRLILTYPAAVGRNTGEILRCLDALQLTEKHQVATPVNWQKGDEVVVHASLSNEQANNRFGDFKIIKPYLRMTTQPAF